MNSLRRSSRWHAVRPISTRTIALTAAVASVASVAMALSRPAELSVDGHRIVSDVPPVTQASRAFVPIRAVADGLGAETTFDPKTGAIAIVRGADVLRLRVGDVHATLNGAPMTLKHAPFLVRGRTMIGLHVIARALGTRTHYDAARAQIDVVTPGFVEAGAQHDAP